MNQNDAAVARSTPGMASNNNDDDDDDDDLLFDDGFEEGEFSLAFFFIALLFFLLLVLAMVCSVLWFVFKENDNQQAYQHFPNGFSR